MKKKFDVAFLGVFLALAMIFSYVESLIPFFFGIPGMKLGLANSLILSLMFVRSPKDALIINVSRVILSGILFGNPYSIMYSLSGCFLSFFIMIIMKKSGKFSIVPISVAGGIAHNAGQLIFAMFTLQTIYLGYYFSVLMLSGFITGALMGIISKEIVKRVGG